MTPLEAAAAVHLAVSRLGGGFMPDPGVAARADELGLSFWEFYVAGRAGVLGPVPGSEVATALALLEPGAVTTAWDAVIARR